MGAVEGEHQGVGGCEGGKAACFCLLLIRETRVRRRGRGVDGAGFLRAGWERGACFCLLSPNSDLVLTLDDNG